MRLSPHLLMNDKNFTVYMNSRSLANTAAGLTLVAAGEGIGGLVSCDTKARDI